MVEVTTYTWWGGFGQVEMARKGTAVSTAPYGKAHGLLGLPYNTPQKLDHHLRWKRPPVRLRRGRRSRHEAAAIQCCVYATEEAGTHTATNVCDSSVSEFGSLIFDCTTCTP